VQDVLEKLKVENGQTTLSCETSFKNEALQLGKPTPEAAVTVRGRFNHDPGTPETVSHPSLRPWPSIFQGTYCAAKHSIPRISLKNAFRARLPSKTES
jgi:hypothetical protein